MPAGLQGIVHPQDIMPEWYPDVLWYVREFYVNQFPFVSGLNREPVATPTFKSVYNRHRGQLYNATSALDATDTYSILSIAPVTPGTPGTSSKLGDATSLQVGDTLAIDGERVEVVQTYAMNPAAEPVPPPINTASGSGDGVVGLNQVRVRRGAEGTAAATHTATAQLTLIGNSRNGGETFQRGMRAVPITFLQQCQVYQFPVEVGGQAEAMEGAYNQQPGSILENAKRMALTNMMYDMEKSSLYGLGEAPSVNNSGFANQSGVQGSTDNRPKQIGVFGQIRTNAFSPANGNLASASNGSNYTRSQFVTDVITPMFSVGAPPNIMFCGAAWLGALTLWSQNSFRMEAGQTELGVAINSFTTNLAPGVRIVPTVSLNPYDAILGRKELMFWRNYRGEQYYERGRIGDVVAGDYIGSGAVEMRSEEFHATITGITSFSAN